ncbi:MAG: HEAT repeat domain-containing protein [Acidobacteria bacterium]|nr:HEAT repeat domain-containing protein [Acidobacteriota bacterium]
MGKGSAAKYAASGVSKTITNYKLQIISLARQINVFAFICVLCVLGGKIAFAQNEVELYFIQKVNLGNVEEKRDALFHLRNFESEKASRIAAPALRDKAEIVRATAAFSVIFLPKEEAAQALVPLLQDKSELVRREAAYALGKVRNPNTINALLQILQKDKILAVRAASAVALGEIGDASAIDALTRILQRKPKDEEEFLRRSAARSIGQIAQIIQTGKVKVRTPENFFLEKYKPIEKPTYINLIETFPPFRAANDVLMQVLQNPREFADVRREAAFALGEIADESAIPVLRANLNAEDYYLAEISQESLRKISAYELYEKLDK